MINTLNNAVDIGKKYTQFGDLASYIPELLKYNKDHVGIYTIDKNNNHCFSGDYDVTFTIQSMSKVPLLAYVLLNNSLDVLLNKVTLSATSKDFNSMSQLETDNDNRPFNPFINAGAISIVELVPGHTFQEKFDGFLNFLSKITDQENLTINSNVYTSEKSTGHKNISIAYFLKSVDIITTDVNDVLDFYFKMCSINVTPKIMATIAHKFAFPNDLITDDVRKIVNSLMNTCGLYNGSSEYSVYTGVPSKSSVSGGIISVVPNSLAVSTFGPALDKKGSSISGIEMLKYLSNKLNLNIFI